MMVGWFARGDSAPPGIGGQRSVGGVVLGELDGSRKIVGPAPLAPHVAGVRCVLYDPVVIHQPAPKGLVNMNRRIIGPIIIQQELSSITLLPWAPAHRSFRKANQELKDKMQDMHEFYKEQERQSNKKGIMRFTTYSKAMKYLHPAYKPTDAERREAYTLLGQCRQTAKSAK